MVIRHSNEGLSYWCTSFFSWLIKQQKRIIIFEMSDRYLKQCKARTQSLIKTERLTNADDRGVLVISNVSIKEKFLSILSVSCQDIIITMKK